MFNMICLWTTFVAIVSTTQRYLVFGYAAFLILLQLFYKSRLKMLVK